MIRTRSLVRRTAIVAAAGAAALVLTACGGDSDSAGSDGHNGHDTTATASASASQGRHNAADVAFAQGMIPHHRQAVEMAGLADGRAGSAEVRKLAAGIEKAQGPEIETLSGWLTSWGEDVPAEGGMDHSMQDMDSMRDMDGMMTDKEMTELKSTSGTAFDAAFLEMMIKHHEGAVEMAKTERADGAYGPATKLAGRIITAQSAEIDRMDKLRKN